MLSPKEFAVSDENGNYVYFTDDFADAKREMNVLDVELECSGCDERAAVMQMTDDGYELIL